MHEYIRDTILECGKSTFNVSTVRHSSGPRYVAIRQVIHLAGDRYMEQTIKINPDVMGDLMEVLTDYSNDLARQSPKSLTEDDKSEIVSRYLKMVPIRDLAMQYGRDEDFIEQVLRNRNIEIVPYNAHVAPVRPDNPWYHRRKKRKGR